MLAPSSRTSKQQPSGSIVYRLLRKLLRIWFGLVFSKIRLLRAEKLPNSGAAMLLVSHPPSFLDALILVSAFDRQVYCLVDRKLLQGRLHGLLARALHMIPVEREAEGRSASLERACQVLAGRGEVVSFAELQVGKAGGPPQFAWATANIALEAESRHSGQLGLAIFPTYLFLPIAPSRSSELLIYIDDPLYPQDYFSSPGGDLPDRAGAFKTRLEAACRQNAFGLQPGDIEKFLSDLEEALRIDLEQEWGARQNWKQKVEGFHLSRFLAECVEQMNFLNPGRLAALREFLNAYREARRRWSLRQLELETKGTWVNSLWSRTPVWVETVAGLPIAAYGLVNHLLVGLLLFVSGLLKKTSQSTPKVKWLVRAMIVLGGYAVQIWLCADWLGRGPAGYYALTLPLSGAYLWRYGWLLRSRTRLLLISGRLPRQAAKLRRMRKELLQELNAARNAYAEMLELPH